MPLLSFGQSAIGVMQMAYVVKDTGVASSVTDGGYRNAALSPLPVEGVFEQRQRWR
jgi:hypothetical protein